MNISEHSWARIGKIVTVVGGVLAAILAFLQIREATRRPNVYAVFESQQHLLSPKLRDDDRAKIARGELLRLIDDDEKKKLPCVAILASVKQKLRIDPGQPILLNFDMVEYSKAWRVTVVNDSDEVVRDVRLILPGKGRADVAEPPLDTFNMNNQPLAWKQELMVGSIPPRGRIVLMVWPEEALFLSLEGAKVGLVHEKGTGGVRRMQTFYGLDADLIAWFLGESAAFRFGSAFVLLVGIAGFLWWLVRKGYVVLRPRQQ